MALCEWCGDALPGPRRCTYCGEQYCAEHQLPERHGCSGIDSWRESGGHFDSGFDDSVST